MTKEVRPITQEQRKEFVTLLKDAKTRALELFAKSSSKRYAKAEDAARDSILKRIGAFELAEQYRAARKVVKDTSSALDKLGVFFDDDRVRFSVDVRGDYRTEITEAADAAMEGQEEELRKTFEKAILNVLATDNVDEAKGIVEPLV